MRGGEPGDRANCKARKKKSRDMHASVIVVVAMIINDGCVFLLVCKKHAYIVHLFLYDSV